MLSAPLVNEIEKLVFSFRAFPPDKDLVQLYNRTMIELSGKISDIKRMLGQEDIAKDYMRKRYCTSGQGCTYLEPDYFVSKIIAHVINGKDANFIVEGLSDLLSGNYKKGTRVYGVIGVGVENSIFTTNRFKILLPKDITDYGILTAIFGLDKNLEPYYDQSSDFKPRRLRPNAALCIPFEYRHQFVDESEDSDASDALKIEENFEKASAALMLSGVYAVQPLNSVDVIDHDFAPDIDLSYEFHKERYFVGSDYEDDVVVDGDVFAKYLNCLEDHADWDSLRIPFSRLRRSRISTFNVDAALDQGICLESIYTHGDDLTTEVGYRIRIRAAKFLAVDTQEKALVQSRVANLYKARSEAAHKGKLLSKKQKYDPKDADDLCLSSLRKIVESGKFPIWRNSDVS